MKICISVLSIILTFSSFAETLRGGHDGGGGQGVVCYEGGEITSVRLLDTYEGEILEGLSIPSYAESAENIYQTILNDYAWYFKSIGGEKFLQNFPNTFRFLPKGIRLNLIEDSKPIFIPQGCKIEQLANYQGGKRIFVVGDFWNKLSETDKAALYLHELIWTYERENGVPYSARARRTVARMISTDFIVTAPSTRPRGYMYCDVKDQKTNIVTHSFWFDGKENAIRFGKINGELSFVGHKGILPELILNQLGFLLMNGDGPMADFEELSLPVGITSDIDNIQLYGVIFRWSKKTRTVSMDTMNFEFPGLDSMNAEVICY